MLLPEKNSETAAADDLDTLREKAAALLKVADGWMVQDVAAFGLLRPRSHNTVSNWVRRYRRQGLAGLTVAKGRGRKPAFSPR